MKIAIQSQFKQEHKAWQTSLEFFKQENALLKYRLSEMVDHNEEHGFLLMAEYFQNELLLKDELLNKLLKDLHELQSAEKFSEKIISRQNKLRNEILQAENKFLHLYNEFNERMQQSI